MPLIALMFIASQNSIFFALYKMAIIVYHVRLPKNFTLALYVHGNFVLTGSFAGSQTRPPDNYGLKKMQEWRKH
jgi:hypothetical protein